jgi:hypothetical protein
MMMLVFYSGRHSKTTLFQEREEIVAMVASDPECGDVTPGTGGFRKVRVGREGMEKGAALGLSIFSTTRIFPFSSCLSMAKRRNLI